MPLENNYETVNAFSRETILIILTQYLHVANRPAWTQRRLRIDNRYQPNDVPVHFQLRTSLFEEHRDSESKPCANVVWIKSKLICVLFVERYSEIIE